MAATALDRQRACRARLRAGAIQVTVTVNEMDLTSKLIERGLALVERAPLPQFGAAPLTLHE
jgi:hypothetical protein